MMYLFQAKLRKLAIVTVISVSTFSVAVADDIDVYRINSGVKPNILFIFDRSASMDTKMGDVSRSTILGDVFKNLLANNEEKINAGIGPFYRDYASGVKWPIGDLTRNANEIDPTIAPSDNITSRDVMEKIFDGEANRNHTNVIDALYEGILYFRGDIVSAGGGTVTERFNPQTWSISDMAYTGGHARAPSAFSYTPSDAYDPEGILLPDSSGTCRDYSVGGTVSGDNDCDNSSYTRYDSCSFVAAAEGVGEMCTEYEFTCTEYDESHVCIAQSATCLTTGPRPDTPAYNSCTYYKENQAKGTWAGANYISPIVDSCQQNYMVLLSDGMPNRRYMSTDIKALTGVSECEDIGSALFPNSTYRDTANCGKELLSFASSNDQVAGVPDSTIKTYTIGFANETSGQDYLKELAEAGGGEFFAASNEAELTSAFNGVLDAIYGSSQSFSSASIEVDMASFSHDNRVLFPLFKPVSGRSWTGNLKGYFVDAVGFKDINNEIATVEDNSGTRFSDSAQSFWSLEIDGDQVELGGASSKLDPDNRTIYTFTGPSIPVGGASLNSPDDTYLFSDSNNAITSAMLGVGSDAAAGTAVIDWLFNAPIGDALHAKPVTVKYADKSVTYHMTNHGLLHAFDTSQPTDPTASDTSGGEEIFAFIPPELLPNLASHSGQVDAGAGHLYGLDGNITKWHEDTNNDGMVNNSEEVLLIFGMRRGGNNYHALDVTNPSSPVYKWSIEGAIAPFDELADTWSKMALVSVKRGTDTNAKVLIFSGGYDDVLDDTKERAATIGATLYVVDRDGRKLWSAMHGNMKYSIPADPTVIDSNGDGHADRIYAADTGGQIWRIDFDDVEISSDYKVTLLADLGQIENQKFFYPPSVSLARTHGKEYLSLAIGSGDRTDPLNASEQNRIYMIKDPAVEMGPPSTEPPIIQLANLYDATSNAVNSTDPAIAAEALEKMNNASGWYINLAVGEKQLSRILTFENKILATTMMPITSDLADGAISCSAQQTEGRFYAIDFRTAGPLDPGDGRLNNHYSPSSKTERSVVISHVGIPSEPAVIFPPNGEAPQIVVDKRTVATVGQKLDFVYWYGR